MNIIAEYILSMAMTAGSEPGGWSTWRKTRKQMKSDPFENYPQAPKNKETHKKSLTFKQIFDIIDIEIKRIEKMDIPTWGFERFDLFEVAENISNEIERLQ